MGGGARRSIALELFGAWRRRGFEVKQRGAGVDRVLTQHETRQGAAPRWLTVVAHLLRAQTTVSSSSGAHPTSRSSSMPSLWPPHVSPGDGLARVEVGQWCTAAARV
jgi:hypothetical protein